MSEISRRAFLETAVALGASAAWGNPDLSPHVSFVRHGGHGYAVVRAAGNRLETEFVCIPRPVERSDRNDGGSLARPEVLSVRHAERPVAGSA
jgi:alkaline phosphatase D